jgi:ketosteroid isomerase-like protein
MAPPKSELLPIGRLRTNSERDPAIGERRAPDRLVIDPAAADGLVHYDQQGVADYNVGMTAASDDGANVSNIEIVRAFYAAMAERDFARVLGLLDPACVVTQDSALPWGGRHVGHEGFADFGLALSGTIDSAVAIDAVFEADGDVIQFGHTRGTVRANGATFDIPEVHRWTIRDGKALAAHFAIDTAAMLEALGR